jgi:lipopolysaccharide export system permease protein
MPWTLYRYLLKEIVPYFLVGLLAFTLILLMQKIIFIVEWIVRKGVPFLDVVRLFGCMLPSFFILTLPTALLLAVLLTFSRIHADNELYALKAAGMSLYRLLPPVYLFGAMVTAVSLFLTLWAGPLATRGFQSIFITMATQNVFFGMKERVFFDGLPGHVIYIEHLDSEQERFEGVLIKDQNFPGGPVYYFAREGRIRGDKQRGRVFLELTEGTIQRKIASEDTFQLAQFDRYWLQIDVGRFFSSAQPKDPSVQELTLPELQEKIREQAGKGEDVRRLLLDYHERFALPFGTLVFCTLGIPLSLLSQRSVRYTGFTLSIGVVLLYYVLLQLGTGLILAGKTPVVLGAWLPNVILGTLGLYLLWKKAGERPTRILDGYADAAERIADRLKRWTHHA